MSKINFFAAAILILFQICFSVFSYAESAEDAKKHDYKLADEEVINDRCPVFCTKVHKSTPYRLRYKNKVIGFCTAGALEIFKTDPEKYIKNVR